MRKLIAIVAAVGLAASLGAAPAMAAKKPIKVHESFGAQLAPFPKDERWNDAGFTRPGCSAGEQDVHWTAVEFTAPGKGKLRVWMDGFTGDHDVYVFLSDTTFLRGDTAQVGAAMAPPEEEIIAPLTNGQKVTLVACNWAGHPDVLAHYEGTFR